MLGKSKRIRHRGPDASGCYQIDNNIFLHERLSIIDPSGGAQPIVNPDNGLILCVNGEIYTHETIRQNILTIHIKLEVIVKYQFIIL